MATIRLQKGTALALASSGIAATLLDGGQTAHSTLKLPLNMQINEIPTLQPFEKFWDGQIVAEEQIYSLG